MSKISQKYGQILENYLDRLNSLYCAQGKAFIFKVPTPLQPMGNLPGNGGYVKARKLPAIYVDYSGTLDGGTAVAIEAKCTTVESVSFPFGDRVKQHQRDALTMVHRLGGIAALYVRRVHGMSADDYLVPAVWIDAHTRKSFKWVEVEHYKVPPGMDWLDATCVLRAHKDTPTVSDAFANYIEIGWARR